MTTEKRHPFGTKPVGTGSRCWQYGRAGCRQLATNSVRYGARVYHYCADPAHLPVKESK